MLNEVEIARVGKSFYQVNRRKKLAVPTEFTLTDATIDFYEDHCCATNINIQSAFEEFSKESMDEYMNTILTNDFMSSISIDNVMAIDIDSMPHIHVNIDGKIINISSITYGEVFYNFMNINENFYINSIVEDFTIQGFIRMLEDTSLDFEYYLETSFPDEICVGLTSNKLMFVFLFNLMRNTFIDSDMVEQVKNDIVEGLLMQ